MKTKFFTHTVFFLVIVVLFFIFRMLYSGAVELSGTGVTDFLWLVLWYLGLTLILFCINLIKKRKNRWIIVAVICVFHLCLAINGMFSSPRPLYDLTYVVVTLAPLNTPFLPEFFELPFENSSISWFAYYLIFFYGALLYWYAIYWLSKKVVKYAMPAKKSEL